MTEPVLAPRPEIRFRRSAYFDDGYVVEVDKFFTARTYMIGWMFRSKGAGDWKYAPLRSHWTKEQPSEAEIIAAWKSRKSE